MNTIKTLSALLLVIAVLGCNKATENLSPEAETAYGQRALDNSWPKLGGRSIYQPKNLSNKNFYIVVDNAKNMDNAQCIGSSRSKLAVAKSAMSAFIESTPKSANIGIASYTPEGLDEYFALQDKSSKAALSAIASITSNNKTVLSEGIFHGFKALEKQAKQQLGYGEYHLIVVTNSEVSNTKDLDKSMALTINDSSIALSVFSICGSATHPMNIPGVSFQPIFGQGPMISAFRKIAETTPAEISAYRPR